MNKTSRKPVIGIIGGIASGKSTVASEFARLGCKVIDADKIAHALLSDSAVKRKILDAFGEDILDENKDINRKKLADIVFKDGGKLSILNNIIHPLVLKETKGLINKFTRDPAIKAIVLDMPLLAEVGWQKKCDKVIFVESSPANRLKRAKKKGLSDENQLKLRENFQISLDKKVSMADNVICNNSSLSALIDQVAEVFSNIAEGT